MIEFAIAAFFYVGTIGIMGLLINLQGERDAAERARRDAAMDKERAEWAEERHQLLERIQRPEYKPVPRQEDYEQTQIMDIPESDFSMVGAVVSEASPEVDDG